MTKLETRSGPPRLTRAQAKMLRILRAGVPPTWAPSYRQTLNALQRMRLVDKSTGCWRVTARGIEALEAYDARVSSPS